MSHADFPSFSRDAKRSGLRALSRLLLCALCVLCGAHPLAAEEEYPRELVEFVPAAVNPVFEGRGLGYWDAKIRERGWILREGNTWHLWYTGYDGPQKTMMKLGYATSPDGITWKRYSEQPIYDQHWVEDMMVVKQGDTYYMFAEGLNDQAQLLTSTDRVHWTRVGTLDIRMKDGSPLSPGPFGTPVGWYENDTWHLFYERRDAGVWLATSKNLKVWTNVQDEPVMVPGPQQYDRDLIAFNQLVKHKGRYYVIYHGTAKTDKPSVWTTNIAMSDDLVHWKKYADNPLTLENKSSGILVDAGTPDKPELRLYTMHDKVQMHWPASHREETKQYPDGRIVFVTDSNPDFEFTRPGSYILNVIEEPFDFELNGRSRPYVTHVLGLSGIDKAGIRPLPTHNPVGTVRIVAEKSRAIVLVPISEGVLRLDNSADSTPSQADDGTVTFHARYVTIHGIKVQYEPKPEKNTIGFWTNVNDWVSWDFTLIKPGTFNVEILQGCGKGQGGSEVDLTLAAQTLRFTVEDTGHFQNFVPRTIGTVKLDVPGEYRLAVKPVTKAKAAVMDLRQVRLIPVEAPKK